MNNPFDTVNIGLRERPLSKDWNRAQSQIYNTIRELARAMLAGRATTMSPASQSRSGFIGDGLQAVPSSPTALSVQVSAGFGFIYDPTDPQSDIGATDLEDVDDLSPFKPVFLMSPLTFAVPAPGGGNSRIDIIEVRTDRRLEDAIVRRQLDVATKQFLDHSFYKTLAYALDGRSGVVTNAADSTAGISYKRGIEAVTPAEPAPTTGYTQIARINVTNGITAVAENAVVDRRPLLGVGGAIPFSLTLRHQSAGPVVTIHQSIAPPGVKMGFKADAVSPGLGTFGLVGGNIIQASVTSNSQFGPGLAGNNVTGGVSGSGFPWVRTVDASRQTLFAAMTPPLAVAIGQQVVSVPIVATAYDGTPTVILATDVVHTISGLLSY